MEARINPSEWISLQLFQERHGLTKWSVERFAFDPKNKEFVKKVGSSVFIWEKEIVRRFERKKRIWHFCTTIYYPLEEIFGSYWMLAKRLSIETEYTAHSWAQFLQKGLWGTPSQDTILNFRFSKKFLIFGVLGSKYLYIYKKDIKDEV